MICGKQCNFLSLWYVLFPTFQHIVLVKDISWHWLCLINNHKKCHNALEIKKSVVLLFRLLYAKCQNIFKKFLQALNYSQAFLIFLLWDICVFNFFFSIVNWLVLRGPIAIFPLKKTLVVLKKCNFQSLYNCKVDIFFCYVCWW